MNKIMDVVGGKLFINTFSRKQYDNFIGSMLDNNTYCPAISRVIFNTGKKAYPVLDDNGKRVKDKDGKIVLGEPVNVLATVIYFADNTKVTVTNSEHDGLTFDKNGNVTESSKEAGVVYAIVKRMFGEVDDNGTVIGNGFGRKLRDICKSAYDTQVETVKRKAEKEAARKAHAEKKANAKPRNPSFAETVRSLDEITKRLDSVVSKWEGTPAAAKTDAMA